MSSSSTALVSTGPWGFLLDEKGAIAATIQIPECTAGGTGRARAPAVMSVTVAVSDWLIHFNIQCVIPGLVDAVL